MRQSKMGVGKIITGIMAAGVLFTSGYHLYKHLVPATLPNMGAIRQIARGLGDCADEAYTSTTEDRRDCIDLLAQQTFGNLEDYPSLMERLTPAIDNMLYIRDSYEIVNNPETYSWSIDGLNEQIDMLTQEDISAIERKFGLELSMAKSVLLLGGLTTALAGASFYLTNKW